MRIKATEAKRRIKLLTDPQPSFMALVDHGAVQTPWASVKNVRGKKPAKGTDMAVKGKGSKAPASKLTKMQFSKDKFKTVKAVTDYLAENGIEGAGKVQDGDDVWIVKSTEDFSNVTLGKARSTATKHEGVTAFIAPITADEADDGDEGDGETTSKTLRDGSDDDDDGDGEDGEDGNGDDNGDEGDGDGDDETGEDDGESAPTSKGQRKAASKVKNLNGNATKVRRAPKPKRAANEDEDETIEPVLELGRKFDWWGAYSSDDQSLSGVLQDGMRYDNVPPGMEDVMLAAFVTIGNVLSDDSSDSAAKLTALKQMGDELATLTVGLFDLFNQASDDATKSLKPSVRKAAKQFSESFAESVARMAEGDLSAIANVDNDDDTGTTGKSARKSARTEDDPLVKRLLKQVGDLTRSVEATNQTLRRAPAQRSMSDSLLEIVDEDDLEIEEEEGCDADRLEEIRRSMGLAPSQGVKQPVAA